MTGKARLFISIAVLLSACITAALLVLCFADPIAEQPFPDEPSEIPPVVFEPISALRLPPDPEPVMKTKLPERIEPVAVSPPVLHSGPRRIPVTGSNGYTVVVHEDGSSTLESPDGSTRNLAPAPRPVPVMPALERIKRTLDTPQSRIEDAQIVILDHGVVSIPRGATITFLGADHLVTFDDGKAVAYFVDGHIETRSRRGTHHESDSLPDR